MLGDLDEFDNMSEEVDFYGILYLFFIAASLILYITMLNLLIAIISDTFSKVKASENLTKIWEKWNIITEMEIPKEVKKTKIVEENQKKEKKFLVFLYNKKNEDSSIEKKIKRMEKTFLNAKKESLSLKEISDQIAGLKNMIENKINLN